MAGRDGRGPLGEGAMTGRGMGICPGSSPRRAYPGMRRANRGRGADFGGYGFGRANDFQRPRRRGCGLGLGYGAGYFQAGDISEEEFLAQERRALEARLEEISDLLED